MLKKRRALPAKAQDTGIGGVAGLFKCLDIAGPQIKCQMQQGAAYAAVRKGTAFEQADAGKKALFCRRFSSSGARSAISQKAPERIR